jgi:hypothetical protein
MFQPYALLVIAPVVGLGVYCVSHVLVSRAARKRGHYFPLFLGCLIGLAATIGGTLAMLALMQAALGDGLALAVMNVVCYLALSFGYFNFINLNIASLRIRMLQELADSGGTMPMEKLSALYNTDAVIALRIDRLAAGGHLVERDGRYYTGKRAFLVVGRIFDLLRLMILGSKLPLSKPVPAGRDRTAEVTS